MNFTVTYNNRVLSDLSTKIKKAPATILDVAEKTIPSLMQRELEPLTTEPRIPTLPFIWSFDPAAQARARRYYFGVKLKGKPRGGRYSRTHMLVNQWKKIIVARTPNEATFTTGNDMPGLDYVQGPSQVPSHNDSGWGRYDIVLPSVGDKVFNALSTKWFDVLD